MPRSGSPGCSRLFLILTLPLLLGGCNPLFVARAGWAQAQILTSREPLTQAITDPATEPRTAGKLGLVLEARRFASDSLGFQNTGESFTSLARLPSDTLALVLSAAYRDRLAFRTWWFPITGHVPYRAYFSTEGAERARDALEAEGFDTYLRPTAAFSTLGWFADPVYSTLLRQDEVGVVETIFHELAHNHLFLPGQGRFNESYASFAGHVAAIHFFCRRRGGGPDTVWCRRAQDRWADAQDVSRYLMELEREIREMYGNPGLTPEERVGERTRIYEEALEEFRTRIQPGLRATRYTFLAGEELNNATLLARTLYFHRLEDFQRLLDGWEGDLAGVMEWIREEAPEREDPFSILGQMGSTGASRTGAKAPG